MPDTADEQPPPLPGSPGVYTVTFPVPPAAPLPADGAGWYLLALVGAGPVMIREIAIAATPTHPGGIFRVGTYYPFTAAQAAAWLRPRLPDGLCWYRVAGPPPTGVPIPREPPIPAAGG